MKTVGVIPCMITLGNAVCGFSAIIKISQADAGDPRTFLPGAWLILLAMVFDAFDGKVARLTKQTSEFGKHLDSLSDAISFGIAPAFMVALMNKASDTPTIWPKAVWFFCLVFALCSLLRLARYNVEAKPGTKGADSFKGLPTPAAAGMIAALVIFSDFLRNLPKEDLGDKLLNQQVADRLSELVLFPLLPAVTLIVGSLMVSSRIFYPHLVNRYISGKRTFEYFVSLIVIVFLAAAMREITLVVGFGAYVLSGPVGFILQERKRRAGLKDVALRS